MIKQVQLQWTTLKSRGYRERCWSNQKLLHYCLLACKELLYRYTHSYKIAYFTAPHEVKDHVHLTTEVTFSFLKFAPTLNKSGHFICAFLRYNQF